MPRPCKYCPTIVKSPKSVCAECTKKYACRYAVEKNKCAHCGKKVIPSWRTCLECDEIRG
jgi:hypothetical protein